MSNFRNWFSKEALSQGLGLMINALIPGLTTAATVWLGVIENFGGPIIILIGSIVFFFSAASLFMFQASRWFADVEHKLRYMTTIVPIDLEPDKRAAQARTTIPHTLRKIQKMQIGVQLVNSSNYPISAFIESANTNVEGRCPQNVSYPKKATIIGPGNQVWMTDDPIEMKGTPCGYMQGRIDIVIRYREKGKKKSFLLEFKGDLQIFMQDNGIINQIYTNFDPAS